MRTISFLLDDAPALRRKARAALGLREDQTLLAAPAEMTRHAGHRYASWIHAILRYILPGVRLLLPGGGPAERLVRNFAATTGFDEEVFLTGRQLSARETLAAADVALFLHERDCALGDLAAAMAAGLPIVASDTPEAAELIEHERTGLLAAPRDPRAQAAAALRLIETPALARRLGGAAARHAKKHFRGEICRKKLTELHAHLTGALSR